MSSDSSTDVECWRTVSPMDRRTAIADAAIEVLARDGMRGLTHRAVDRSLDLAVGSTSYYFRTRETLVGAAAERLVDLDRVDVQDVAPTTEGISRLVDRWLLPDHRARLVARFELFLAAARSTDAPLERARAEFGSVLAAALADAGARDPAAAALMLNATIEGLLLDGVLGPGRTAAERHAAIDLAMRAAIAG